MAEARGTQAHFYTWQAPGKQVVVHLSLDVVDRIAQEALRGLSALPRRGAEIGGILLGAAQPGDPAVVKVVDSAPVLCGHYFGPSYVLTQDEKQTLQQALARWKPLPLRSVYAVGYYRSHTRDELFLSDDDVWLMSTYFADPSRVALLVKPRTTAPSTGGFFFWEGDRIRADSCYSEFPFELAALRAAEPEPPATEAGVSVAEPAPTLAERPPAAAEPESFAPPAPERPAPAPPPPQPAPPVVEPAWRAPEIAPPTPSLDEEPLPLPSFLRSMPPRRQAGLHRKIKIPWLWIAAGLALVLLGGFLGTRSANYLNPGVTSDRGADPYALHLAVTEYGDNLHLTWDRHAAALRQAHRGVLIIGDGDQTRTLEMDAAQLRNGSVIYRRASGPVRFRLELYLKGNRSLSEAWEPAP